MAFPERNRHKRRHSYDLLLDLYRGFERQVLEIRTHAAEDLIKDMADSSSTGNIMSPADKRVSRLLHSYFK